MTKKDVLKLLKDNLLEDCSYWTQFTELEVDDIIESLPISGLDYTYGASKLVLFLPETNFVVKIPFRGCFDNEEENFPFDDDVFQENTQACLDKDYYWDYCAAETIVYQKAKAENVEQAFAKTVYIGSIANHPIYVQEKAKTLSSNMHSHYPSPEEIEKTKKSNAKARVSLWNATWQTHALKYYGEKQYIKIMQFIKKEGINDLGCTCNIGYINNRPVLIDYSSYRESY